MSRAKHMPQVRKRGEKGRLVPQLWPNFVMPLAFAEAAAKGGLGDPMATWINHSLRATAGRRG